MEIPKFYFPNGKPLPEARQSEMHARIESLMKEHPDGLTVPGLKELLKQVKFKKAFMYHFLKAICTDPHCCEEGVERVLWTMQVLDLPGLLAYPLFYKLVEPGASFVRKEALLDWMKRCNVLQVSRLFCPSVRLLKCRGQTDNAGLIIFLRRRHLCCDSSTSFEENQTSTWHRRT